VRTRPGSSASIDFVDRANIRVVQGGSGAGFGAESFQRLRIIGKSIGKELQRHFDVLGPHRRHPCPRCRSCEKCGIGNWSPPRVGTKEPQGDATGDSRTNVNLQHGSNGVQLLPADRIVADQDRSNEKCANTKPNALIAFPATGLAHKKHLLPFDSHWLKLGNGWSEAGSY